MSSNAGSTNAVKPDDSVSNAPASDAAPTGEQKPRRGRGPRKTPTTSVPKDAPQGALEVQNGGQNKTGRKSQVVSTTIPISGWGSIDLASHRADIRPEFTVDANPYMDLVDAVYMNMEARFSMAKHIPYALFAYYCIQMWWQRVLFLHKSNGNVLSQEERQALNVLLAGDEFMVPGPIAQYLANLGNFQQGGETFYFRKLPTDFSGSTTDGNVEKGWLKVGDGIRVTDSSSFWKYAQVPVPGVVATFIQAEANNCTPNPNPRPTLDHISPIVEGQTARPTANIVGWKLRDLDAHHSSWRGTYSSLGWSLTSTPIDIQTNFNISNSTMKWMSEKLETITGLKLHSSKQLTLSTQGNPILAQYLTTGHWTDAQWLQRSEANLDDRKGTLSYDLTLCSRFSMDSAYLAPSFSFGYRLERKKVSSTSTATYGFSEYDPWIFFKNDTHARQNLPANWWNEANATFTLGSQAFINLNRFQTYSLNRSNGLHAAVVLSAGA